MKEGKRIKELRNALNLNQTNFGEQLGLKQTTIAGYENNHRELTDRTISDLCRRQ